jgi:hypothetical protein
MIVRARSFWVATLSVAYVAFAALSDAEGRGPAWLALVGLPIALAVVWSMTSPLSAMEAAAPDRAVPHAKPGEEDATGEGARAAARVAFTGAAILVAAKTGPDGPWLMALGNLGAALASMAALVALSRLPSAGGLLEPPASARRLDAAAFASLFWTVAVALPAAKAIAPERADGLHPLAVEAATVAAALGSMGVSVAALARTRSARKLELGAGDRTAAALFLTITALLVGVLAAAVDVADPERVLPITAAVAALGVTWSVIAREATSVARALRMILAVVAPAAPIALFAVYISYAAPGRAGAVTFLACAACAVVGLMAPLLGRRFAPEADRWVRALDAATEAAMNPDPDAALEDALAKLPADRPRPRQAAVAGAGAGAGAAVTSAAPALPALYRLSPAERVTVDHAGYAHVERVEIPERLVALAGAEPLRVLRTEVLRAVEVRRPDVRPLIAWLDQRSIGAAALIGDATGPIGALTIPRGSGAGGAGLARGGSRAPMSIEEVRALRALADRLGAVLGVSSMLARSREREGASRAELEARRAEVARLEVALRRGAARFQALAQILARPARDAAYSPPARAAVEQLERLGEAGRPITLLAAPGVDAVAWAALAHLASSRKDGALVIVDGTSPGEQELLRWRDPDDSPLRAAAGGTLVVLDAQALPLEVQSYLGAALPEDVGLVVAVPSTADTLVASGRMSERLADRLGDRAVALPTLASRAEDLRALALTHLARIGTRVRGQPIGLDMRALAALGEHLWPGNDAELYAVLLRAALVAEGDVVGVRELAATGFTPSGEGALSLPYGVDTSERAASGGAKRGRAAGRRSGRG